MRRRLLPVISLLFFCPAWGQGGDDFVYEVQPQESISVILKKKLRELTKVGAKIYGKDNLLDQTIVLNTHIKDPNKIYPKMKLRLPKLFVKEKPIASEVTPTPPPEPPKLETPVNTVTQPEPPSETLRPLDEVLSKSLALGAGSQSYLETGISEVSQKALTLRGDYHTRLVWIDEKLNRFSGGGFG